jgi:hypothetical protein
LSLLRQVTQFCRLHEPPRPSLKTVKLLPRQFEKGMCFLCNRVANKGKGVDLLNSHSTFWFLLWWLPLLSKHAAEFRSHVGAGDATSCLDFFITGLQEFSLESMSCNPLLYKKRGLQKRESVVLSCESKHLSTEDD